MDTNRIRDLYFEALWKHPGRSIKIGTWMSRNCNNMEGRSDKNLARRLALSF